jgi:hypothetical protein
MYGIEAPCCQQEKHGICGIYGTNRLEQHISQFRDCRRETCVLAALFSPLHPEIDDRTTTTASIARPKIPFSVYLEAGVLVIVEWAMPQAMLIKFNVLADKVKNRNAVFNAF